MIVEKRILEVMLNENPTHIFERFSEMEHDTFLKKVLMLCLDLRVTGVMRIAGVSRPAIYAWLNGVHPRDEHRKLIERIYRSKYAYKFKNVA